MSLPSSDAADFAEFERLFRLSLDEGQRHLVRDYWLLLQTWNRKAGLTSIRNFRLALQFHFFEAFWAYEQFLKGMHRIVDVGSGAGFPGLAIKLYRPALEVALLESNRKKAIFLAQAARQLHLDVEVFDAPAEEFTAWKRVDAAMIRALKPSSELTGILTKERIPLIRFHGSSGETPTDMRLGTRQNVPGSRNRIVSCYLPI